jgi:hypothetical protein
MPSRRRLIEAGRSGQETVNPSTSTGVMTEAELSIVCAISPSAAAIGPCRCP